MMQKVLQEWWIGSETFLSKLVVKHYDAHDFFERICYDSMTFQCVAAHVVFSCLFGTNS